jgi:hypothetical protein
MPRRQRAEEPTSELLKQFIELAQAHGSAAEAAVANKAARALLRVAAKLRARGTDDRRQLLSLLGHEEEHVRLWAATHSLDIDSDQAVRVLESLATGRPGPARASANITLQQWRAGTLILP